MKSWSVVWIVLFTRAYPVGAKLPRRQGRPARSNNFKSPRTTKKCFGLTLNLYKTILIFLVHLHKKYCLGPKIYIFFWEKLGILQNILFCGLILIFFRKWALIYRKKPNVFFWTGQLVPWASAPLPCPA